MRYPIVATAILAWFAFTSPGARACSCFPPGTPCESFGSAAAVFSGTATSVRDPERPRPGEIRETPYMRIFKFSVDQAYSGVDGTEVEVLTGNGGGDCGYRFTIGERYLVYAYVSENRLVTSICSRTKLFENADEDLEFLGNLSSATRGATIYGRVARAKGAKNDSPLPSDVLINIEGDNVRREIRPDTEGRYRVTGLPAGHYKVTLKLPEKLIAERLEREIRVADRGCASVVYYISDNGRLSGKVLDAAGQPVVGISIALVESTADPKKHFINFGKTDSEGRYSITGVPPGDYLLTINVHSFRTAGDPMLAYPPAFYPGVAEQVNAEVITVGAGEKLMDLDIRVPLRRPESIITGEVVWADGSPVANATVSQREAGANSGYSSSAKADGQGRFTLESFVGQSLIIDATSNRPYVQVPNRYEPMERSEPVRITVEKPKEKIRIVITKLR